MTSCYRCRVRTFGALLALAWFGSLASCGGSSSETPPPLEPLPVNVHYNRSATTLPGDIGPPPKPATTEPPAEPEEAPEEPSAKPKPLPPPAPKH